MSMSACPFAGFSWIHIWRPRVSYIGVNIWEIVDVQISIKPIQNISQPNVARKHHGFKHWFGLKRNNTYICIYIYICRITDITHVCMYLNIYRLCVYHIYIYRRVHWHLDFSFRQRLLQAHRSPLATLCSSVAMCRSLQCTHRCRAAMEQASEGGSLGRWGGR